MSTDDRASWLGAAAAALAASLLLTLSGGCVAGITSQRLVEMPEPGQDQLPEEAGEGLACGDLGLTHCVWAGCCGALTRVAVGGFHAFPLVPPPAEGVEAPLPRFHPLPTQPVFTPRAAPAEWAGQAAAEDIFGEWVAPAPPRVELLPAPSGPSAAPGSSPPPNPAETPDAGNSSGSARNSPSPVPVAPGAVRFVSRQSSGEATGGDAPQQDTPGESFEWLERFGSETENSLRLRFPE